MKSEKVLSSSMLGALGLATIGFNGQLPSPRRYVAIFLLWGVLGLAAQGGPEAARATSRFSVLVLLTLAMAVAAKLIGFLDLVAKLFPTQPAPLQTTAASQPQTGVTA